MHMRTLAAVAAGLGLVQNTQAAITADLNDPASIKSAAKQVAADLWTFYPQKPGWFIGLLDLPPPDGKIAWWVSGAFWQSLIEYRQTTGDKTYDTYIQQSIIAQSGDNRDFLPRNWTSSIGNDDQSFWAFTSLMAAEAAMPDPPADQPQYLALTQAVFNQQTIPDRRAPNNSNCGGGLRWQRSPVNAGYTYVNTIANACFFNIGARLARYTHNDTYVELGKAIAENMFRLGYIDSEFNVYDGAHVDHDCTDVNRVQYSYNAALLLQSCAFMYNITNGDQVWKDRVDGLLSEIISFFFPDGIAVERSCEPQGACDNDKMSFKGYLHRWLGSTAQLVPYTQAKINPILKTSAAAALKQCVGGTDGNLCGFNWADGKYDGTSGAVQQMNVLGALTALLAPASDAPVTNGTGGTSVGNPDAGGNEASLLPTFPDITTGDRVGAGILTTLILAGALGVFAWLNLPEHVHIKY